MSLTHNKKPLALSLLVLLLLASFTLLACATAPPRGWSGPTALGDGLFVGSRAGKVVAVKPADGKVMADFPPQGLEPLKGIYGVPAVDEEMVYVGAYSGKVYALRPEAIKDEEDRLTLTMKWQYPEKGYIGAIVGSPVVSRGLVYVGSSDKKLYALSAASGRERWSFTTRNKVWSTPAVVGGVVYFGSMDGKLYALAADSGEKLWEFKAEGAIATTPLIQGGRVYVGSFDRRLYALDAKDGKEIWRFPAENWFWARPLIYQDMLYAASLDGKLYALELASGKKLAEYTMGAPVRSDPVLAEGFLVLGAVDGQLYSLDLATKAFTPLLNLGAPVQSALFSRGTVVYAHTQNGILHAVEAKTGRKLWGSSLIK